MAKRRRNTVKTGKSTRKWKSKSRSRKSKLPPPRLVVCPQKKIPMITGNKPDVFRKKRKGKISKWVKGALASLAPAAVAVGIGTIKKLMRKNTGYSDIFA